MPILRKWHVLNFVAALNIEAKTKPVIPGMMIEAAVRGGGEKNAGGLRTHQSCCLLQQRTHH